MISITAWGIRLLQYRAIDIKPGYCQGDNSGGSSKGRRNEEDLSTRSARSYQRTSQKPHLIGHLKHLNPVSFEMRSFYRGIEALKYTLLLQISWSNAGWVHTRHGY